MMLHDNPFTVKVSDYSQLEGWLYLEDGGLRLELYHKETVLNVFGSNAKCLSDGWMRPKYVVISLASLTKSVAA